VSHNSRRYFINFRIVTIICNLSLDIIAAVIQIFNAAPKCLLTDEVRIYSFTFRSPLKHTSLYHIERSQGYETAFRSSVPLPGLGNGFLFCSHIKGETKSWQFIVASRKYLHFICPALGDGQDFDLNDLGKMSFGVLHYYADACAFELVRMRHNRP
jgi:hypothetical protein